MTATSHGRILVVDDTPEDLRLLRRLLSLDGYDVKTLDDPAAALTAVPDYAPDVILSDVMMPGMTGFELCSRLKTNPATRLIPLVLITSLQAREDKIQGINAGADDFLSKPVNPHELRARVRSLVRLKQFTDDLDSAEAVILSLGLIIEARDGCTEGHCQRVAAYATALGIEFDLPDEELAALHRAGFLHDVGKVGIPDALLLKRGGFDEAERRQMQTHTVIGDGLCGQLRTLARVRPLVRWHHERLDGSGYPDGLHGDQIPLAAQILSVVDAFDAMTTDRPYRDAMTTREALAELLRDVRSGWRRADLVEAWEALVESRRFERLSQPAAGPAIPYRTAPPEP